MPIEEIMPETRAIRVRTPTVSQPCPKTRVPSATPTAPKNWGTAMFRTRIR